VVARRTAKAPKRPLADILIGAFTSRCDGILTRNKSDFRTVFPKLAITAP
jgi:predicted nucleic acid-binding protein